MFSAGVNRLGTTMSAANRQFPLVLDDLKGRDAGLKRTLGHLLPKPMKGLCNRTADYRSGQGSDTEVFLLASLERILLDAWLEMFVLGYSKNVNV